MKLKLEFSDKQLEYINLSISNELYKTQNDILKFNKLINNMPETKSSDYLQNHLWYLMDKEKDLQDVLYKLNNQK